MKTHPVADLFPMLPDDELRDLADDIAQRGLLAPIVRHDGAILDGRNRFAACKLAGVPPTYVEYDGGDPAGYALMVNIARRHLSKGQQAMVVAKAIRSGALKQSTRKAGAAAGISDTRITFANVVLDYAPDMADGVIAGPIGIDAAYTEAKKRKAAAASTETQMAKLRDQAPDLADQVVEERLTLNEAVAAAHQRTVDDENDRRSGINAAQRVNFELLSDVVTIIDAYRLNADIDLPGLLDLYTKATDAIKEEIK